MVFCITKNHSKLRASGRQNPNFERRHATTEIVSNENFRAEGFLDPRPTRRLVISAAGRTSTRFGRFELRHRRGELLADGVPVSIGRRTFELLELLIEAEGEIVTKEEIFRRVWRGQLVDENNLPVHVSALRKALGGDRDIVKTVPGRGYLFAADVTIDAGPSTGGAADTQSGPAAGEAEPPAAPGGLIGREEALADVRECLGRHRLVTLTGAGGIGKTRLAIELGRQMSGRFPGGVRLIDLAPAADPVAVPSIVAAALGVTLRTAEAAAETIAGALGADRMLLIFDNCEHLAEAAASLIAALLDRAPALSVLATSQKPLRIDAERLYRLDPLGLPPAGAVDIGRFGAVALFVARARALNRHFVLDADNGAAVAEICRGLDGVPLAIEMAAARLPLLGLEGLRRGLDARLRMLKDTRQASDARHRTLRALVDWSHDLLGEAERRAFRRLSLFAGSFSLDAAVAVAGMDDADRWDIVDALERLIDMSMVQVDESEPPRYRLLETLRLYAAEALSASGERASVARQHARYYTALFERAYAAWDTTLDGDWLAAYRPEIDNVRAALDWALADPEHAPIAIALAGVAPLLWERLNLIAEGRRYVDQAGKLVDRNTPPADEARLARQSARLWRSSDRPRALALLERSAALYRRLGDRLNLGSVLGPLGDLYIHMGRHAEAQALLNEARAILAGSERTKSLYAVMFTLGVLAAEIGERAEARRCYARALDLARDLKDRVRESNLLINIAEIDFATGAVDRAAEAGRAAVTGLRATHGQAYLGIALVNLASYLIAQDDLTEARSIAEEALSMACDHGGLIVWICLERWALLGALAGRYRETAQVMGFVETSLSRAGETRQATDQRAYDRLTALLAAALPTADIDAFKLEGCRWSEAQAVRFAQDHLIRPACPLPA
jgi:predicted ATPase/DNA-binding winged helix-turn-helix (wHTH) protein